MADTSDLHPAVLHALRTGKIDQALAAALPGANPSSRNTRTPRPERSRQASNRHDRSTEAEEDAFFKGFNNNPLR